MSISSFTTLARKTLIKQSLRQIIDSGQLDQLGNAIDELCSDVENFDPQMDSKDGIGSRLFILLKPVA